MFLMARKILCWVWTWQDKDIMLIYGFNFDIMRSFGWRNKKWCNYIQSNLDMSNLKYFLNTFVL